MALARAKVNRNGVMDDLIQPGDVVGIGESVAAGTVATTGTTDALPAAAIATGLVRRTGPTANYADVWGPVSDLIAALQGNGYAPESIPGISFRLRILNTVAFTATPTFGTGWVAGVGTTSQLASAFRDYLITTLNVQPVSIFQSSFLTASKVVTFVLPSGQSSFKLGPNAERFCTTGASASGTGIATGTKVAGITLGQGGIIGCTLDTNTTAPGTNVAITFGPTAQVDSIGSGSL